MRWILLSIAMLAGGVMNAGAAASAKAEFSSNHTRVGQPVELRLIFEGGGNVSIEDQLDVASLGLSVVSQNTSRQFVFENGRQTNRTTLSVVVRPEAEGEITVPPIEVSVDGVRLRTNPVTLRVLGARQAVPGNQGGPGAVPPGGLNTNPRRQVQPSTPPDDESPERQFGYIELLVPKATAYEGELIPAEIRIYLNARNRYRPEAPPEITGQGFTLQKLTKPEESTQPIDGERYHVISFKTAISAAKPGKITVGPAQVNWAAFIPSQRRRSGFRNDPFADMDDFFNNFGALGGGMEQVKLNLKSDPVELDVKPLPKEGRPADFDGAVGQFAMSTEVKPEKADAGEPITLMARITGTGNFDRVTAPTVEESSDWRVYPPSGKFEADDDVGLSGTKTFETVLTAKSAQKATPAVTFSYFDPVAEKYVSLSGGPHPIQIVGTAAVQSATPAPTATPADAPTPGASPAEQATATDILFIRPELGHVNATFEPVWRQGGFQKVQWAAGSTLLLTVLGFALASRSRNQARKHAQAVSRDLSSTMAKLRKSDAAAAAFYSDAAHYLSVAAAASGAPGHPDSPEEVCAVKAVSDEVRAEIDEIFRNRDSLRYGRAGDERIDDGVRKRVLAALEAYQKSSAQTAPSYSDGAGALIALVIAAGLLLNPSNVRAETPEERFEKGNKAYEAGQYQDAVREYEFLAQTGSKSANLYFNLGDAWYRLGENGKAILNYERALALNPGHPEALSNLRFVRKQAGSFSVDPPWWLSNIEAVGVNRLPWLASGAFWVGAFLIVFGLFRLAGMRGVWTTFGVLSWVGAAVFAAGLWLYADRNGVTDAGVVISPKVMGRVSPTDSAKETGSIPVGTRVRMLSDRGSWVYVEMPDGTRGFIPEGTVERIRPASGSESEA